MHKGLIHQNIDGSGAKLCAEQIFAQLPATVLLRLPQIHESVEREVESGCLRIFSSISEGKSFIAHSYGHHSETEPRAKM